MIIWLFTLAISLGLGYAFFWLFRSLRMMGNLGSWLSKSSLAPPRPSQIDNNPQNDDDGDEIIPPESISHIRATAASIKPVKLEWADISLSRGHTEILSRVSGYARPGEIMALMGASGAGKSTLLEVLAMRNENSHMKGSIHVNGLKIKRADYMRLSAFVPQDQHLLPQMTCEEVLAFYTGIRGIKGDEAKEGMERSLSVLGLTSCAQTMVGGSLLGGITIRGLSGGEKKRLSIALGLISHPSLLLIDEPTSGLDSYASLSVMAYLKALAHSGSRTVVVSIHQPRSAIWSMFDSCLLLAQGRVMFMGRCDEIVPWFTAQGSVEYNAEQHGVVCDWMIDLVSDIGKVKEYQEAFDERQGQAQQDVEAQHKVMLPASSHLPQESETLNSGSIPAGSYFIQQFLVLYKREAITALRNPADVAGRMLLFTVLGVVSNFIVVDAKSDAGSISQRIVWLFAQGFFYLVIPYTFLSLFVADKRSLMEDQSSKTFSLAPYYAAKHCAVVPSNALIALVFQSIAYGMLGFRHNVLSYLQSTSCAIVLSLISLQWMNFAVALTPNQDLAFAVSIAFTIMNILLSSIFLTSPSQQSDSEARKTGWIWNLRVLSALEWSFEGGMIAEFKDRVFACPLSGPLPLGPFNIFPQILSSSNPILSVIKSGLMTPNNKGGCVAQGNAILTYFSISGSAGSKLGVLFLYLFLLHVLTFVVLFLASKKARG